MLFFSFILHFPSRVMLTIEIHHRGKPRRQGIKVIYLDDMRNASCMVPFIAITIFYAALFPPNGFLYLPLQDLLYFTHG